MCAVGVVTTRRKPLSGRISALAGREGRLRACMKNCQQHYLQQRRSLVTSSIIKSDVVPALRAGASSLFSGGLGYGVTDLHGLGGFYEGIF